MFIEECCNHTEALYSKKIYIYIFLKKKGKKRNLRRKDLHRTLTYHFQNDTFSMVNEKNEKNWVIHWKEKTF